MNDIVQCDTNQRQLSKQIIQTCQEAAVEPLDALDTMLFQLGVPVLQRTEVQSVVVICASSRGGSTWLFRQLSKSAELLSPRGEQVPFERLYLGADAGSDYLDGDDCAPAIADNIWRALYSDCGAGLPANYEYSTALYTESLALRLMLQWPTTVRPKDVRDVAKAVNRQAPRHTGPRGAALFRQILSGLERTGQIDTAYYDRDPLLVLNDRATSEPRGAPNDDVLLEEPPFIPILPRLWPAAPDTVRRMPILLKSSLNAYRLEFIRRLFPNAAFRVIHLTRNPAAALNGLMDGWLHWGFHSRKLGGDTVPLQIAGYSERRPCDRRWWKFDLPPGVEWKRPTELASVCAVQWSSAHRHVLEYLAREPDTKYVRIRFEDCLADGDTRGQTLEMLRRFLGLRRPIQVNGEDVIMATQQPCAGRWRLRGHEIMPLLARDDVRDTASALGYDLRGLAAWP